MAESLKPWMCFHLMLADVGIFCLPLLLMVSFQTGIIDATNTCVDCKTGSTLSAKVGQTWYRREEDVSLLSRFHDSITWLKS
jgi:hypothetical protein